MAPGVEGTGEEAVAAAWAQLAAGRVAVTQEGERLRVRFPGLRNPGPGPDFRGALIETERGRLVRGDVEVHRTVGGWEAHGHAGDPRYRRVVLHVVGDDDRGGPALFPAEGRAPVLVVPPCREAGPAAPSGCPATCGTGDLFGLPALLAALGAVRFQRRVRGWRRRLAAGGADAALTGALLQALGNGHDVAPYRKLAAAVSWIQVAAVTAAQGSPGAQALLLGAAGFLVAPSAAGAGLLARLRPHWQSQGRAPVLAAAAWPPWERC